MQHFPCPIELYQSICPLSFCHLSLSSDHNLVSSPLTSPFIPCDCPQPRFLASTLTPRGSATTGDLRSTSPTCRSTVAWAVPDRAVPEGRSQTLRLPRERSHHRQGSCRRRDSAIAALLDQCLTLCSLGSTSLGASVSGGREAILPCSGDIRSSLCFS